jgi:drug/metabolite transporter (DMT)-like permease
LKSLILFACALLAAVGNAMFAMGQKKTQSIENSLVVIALSASICLVLTLVFLAVTGGLDDIAVGFRSNWIWIFISGVGLFLTYLGFNLLYTRYGTTAYVFYAALSVITTSFIVGVLILKENVNVYHLLAGAAALISIALFSLGNRIS